MTVSDLWDDLAASAGLKLSDEQRAQLSRYIDLLLEANATMNLTRIADRASAELLHVADALTLLPHLPRDAHCLADVGSGGGVPGIPLAIARPDARVTLIEATQKKAAFLKRAAADLELKNLTLIPQRAEDAGHGRLRESFDIAAARAVGAMVWLAEWCLPLVKKGGRMLAMKGERIAEELPAAAPVITLLGGGPPAIHPVSLPGTEHHVIVEIAKLARTDAKYPRSATVAKKKPL